MRRRSFICISFVLLFTVLALYLGLKVILPLVQTEVGAPGQWRELSDFWGQNEEYYSPVEDIPETERTSADLILLGARAEVHNGTRYDAAYVPIDYPGGDVSPDRGACTDVVVRAFRNAKIDLQQLIHEDMRENFEQYPQKWGLSGPDANIDHRRVPNQMCFFERHGQSLTLEVEGKLDEWQWGDVVCWRFADGRVHTGVVSDRSNASGIPLVIHNAGVAREEDCLQKWEIIGHFRYPGSD